MFYFFFSFLFFLAFYFFSFLFFKHFVSLFNYWIEIMA